MEFCKRCKGIIIPRTVNNETLMLCNACGWFKIVKGEVELKTKDIVKHKEVVGEGVSKEGNTFASYNHKCSNCGYDKAEIIDLGVFYSDEDNLIFLKCGKCGFSERIGDKVM